MITAEQARTFAQEWIESWNAHDLDRILSHYTDGFEMSSPYIVERGFDPSGTLRGKQAVANYWKPALAPERQLHFELIDVLTGASSVTINYWSIGRRLASEVLFFDQAGKIYRAAAHYRD